jgi:hypothetical protein
MVIIHLLVTLAHGLAHRDLQIGLPPAGSVFVRLVIVIAPPVGNAHLQSEAAFWVGTSQPIDVWLAAVRLLPSLRS